MEPSGGGPLLGEAFGGSSFAFPRLIFFWFVVVFLLWVHTAMPPYLEGLSLWNS